MNHILLIIAIVVFLGVMALRQKEDPSSSQSQSSGGTKLQSRKFSAATTDPDTNIVTSTSGGEYTTSSNNAKIDALNTTLTGDLTVNGNLLKVGGKKSLQSHPTEDRLMINWGPGFTRGIGLDGTVEVVGGNTLIVKGMDIVERINYILNNAIFKNKEYSISAPPGFWGSTKKNYLGVLPDSNNAGAVYANNRDSGYGVYKWSIGD